MPWPLPEGREARLALAKGYPYTAPPASYLFARGEAQPIEEADFRGRVPVVAHGSNRSPHQLKRKYGEGAEIPVTYASLRDCDVVYAAHLTRYGAVASTLAHVPGASARAAITWLSAEQLDYMHLTEGPEYLYGRVESLVAKVEAGPHPEEVFAYIHREGALPRNGHPAALAAVEATGRRHAPHWQESMLEHVRGVHAAEEALDSFILGIIDDPERRRRIEAEMGLTALRLHPPGTVEVG